MFQDNKNLRIISEQKEFTAHDIWEQFGISEHLGGIYATRRLIELCKITLGQCILDIGCGTGYTACFLARDYQVDVVALDVNSTVLERAKKRIIEGNVSDRVAMIRGDVHKLPFISGTFDAVIAESVLAFCDKMKVSSEVYRVLKSRGVFGDNELTFLKPPPIQLTSFLSRLQPLRPLEEDKWRAVYKEAGFEDVSSTVYQINLTAQFRSHLRVDGIRRYLSALFQGVFDPTMRRTFFNRHMFQTWRRFSSYAGYGLYVGRKV